MTAWSPVTLVPGDPVPSSDYIGVCSTFYMVLGFRKPKDPAVSASSTLQLYPGFACIRLFFFYRILEDGTQVLMLAPRTKSSSKPGVGEMTQ